MRGNWHGSLQEEKGFGTRREPAFRRKQTSLWHYGKKKSFLSKLRSIDCSWSERWVRAMPCPKGMTGRKKGIQGFVFKTYWICVTWQIHDHPIQRIIVLLVKQICSLIKSVFRTREIFSASEWLTEERVSFPTLWPVQGWARVILCLFSANGLPAAKPGCYFAPYTLLNKQKVGQQHVWHACDDLHGLS